MECRWLHASEFAVMLTGRRRMGGPQVKEIEQWLSQPWLAVSAMPVASTIIGISRGKAGAVGKVTHPRAPGIFCLVRPYPTHRHVFGDGPLRA